MDYLSEYFSFCKPGDDSRAIPGGRYGCAQFLKLCGNQQLRECSLGKLSYMVQLSIDEDLLRYHRTLLIWVPTSNKSCNDTENNSKLIEIQHIIIDILRESKEGMSLAQLPLYIKRKLSFPLDLAELGFAKLKDLLLTMPEVEIELRGTNHPFAVFKPKRKRNKEDDVKNAINEILIDNNKGVPGPKLEILLNSKLGYFINWGEYKCTSIFEFVQKKCAGIFEVIGNEESKSIIKTKVNSVMKYQTFGIENYDKNEYTIQIIKEQPEFKLQEEFNSLSLNRAMNMEYSKNNNPYAIEEYFDEFNYGNPPGFN